MAHARAATWDRNVQIFDQGILGNPPTYLAKKQMYFYNNKNREDFKNIIDEIVNHADTLPDKKIVNLYIFCHGSYSRSTTWKVENSSKSISEKTWDSCGAMEGGQALRFGTFQLGMLEVPLLLYKLYNKVGKIIFYGCGVAGRATPEMETQAIDSETENMSRACKTGDNIRLIKPAAEKEFCKLICRTTNATVFAADVEQLYQHTQFIDNKKNRKRWNDDEYYQCFFGEWEGQLFEFQPPSGAYKPVSKVGNDYF